MRRKYDSLFGRQPNVYADGLGRIRDENGELTNTWGISVFVMERVDQATLPPEDRIPDSLEGIPLDPKYEGRMHEYPYVHGYAPYALYDENGWPTDKIVVEIYVTQMVDQETLQPRKTGYRSAWRESRYIS